MEDWENEFVPRGGKDGVASNQWEGEDEDDDVKDNWEDEEEEKKAEDGAIIATEVKQKSRKKLQEIIAEKERAKKEELERRAQEQEEEEEDVSPEEQLRREKESDLSLALETTFGGSNKGVEGQPTNKEEFLELAENLSKNLQQFTKNEEYPVFAENLVRGICATLNSFDLKKIKTTIDNMYLEKQKIEKGDKAKKNKGKGKAKLKMDGDNLNQYSAYVDDYDYDDFM
uniref:Eukaryotic translation initiation factor 3 subunit J n=1 Tax=Photinus pyralis TaxID=7054 RepID=A0A1Y1LK34_PHOPY